MQLTESMRQDWDERARKDAFHYIASWRQDWTEESFFQSGEEDYQRLVAPVLQRLQWDPRGKEHGRIGMRRRPHDAGFCPKIFACPCLRHLDGDAETRENIESRSVNIEWTLTNGADLSGLGDGSVDFVFSYIVLHHMPDRGLALAYIREMLRLLKPDGLFLFQFSTLRTPTMNWKGRIAWRIVDIPNSLGLRGLGRGLTSAFGLPLELAGKSWRGSILDVPVVREAVEAAGGSVAEVTV